MVTGNVAKFPFSQVGSTAAATMTTDTATNTISPSPLTCYSHGA